MAEPVTVTAVGAAPPVGRVAARCGLVGGGD